MEVSFVGLIRQLCEHHAESQTEDHSYSSYQPFHMQDNQKTVKQLQKTAYNVYFDCLKKLDRQKKLNVCKTVPGVSGLNNQLVQLLSYVFVLLQQNKYDDAQQLQQLVQKLIEFNSSELESILKFLLCLAGSAKEKKHLLGYENTNYKQKKTSLYPLASMDYMRDTQKYSTEKASFMYYPSFTRDMFEGIGLDCSYSWQNIFSKTPGEGLSKYFNVSNVLNDQHEQSTQSTLFGALTQRNIYTLNLTLELPDLIPNQLRDLNFRNPSCSLSDVASPSSSDKGYHEMSPTEAGNSSYNLYQSDSGITFSSDSSKSIWELALNFEPSKHYTWEVVGKHPGLQERPYLSEAGPRVVDELFSIKMNELSLVCPNLKKPCQVFVSVKELINNIIHLLIGVPSNIFHLNKDENKFYTKDWICISGLTPTALDSMLSLYVETGTIYHRLSLLSHPPICKFSDSGGLTYQAFTRAVNNYLQYYRARILSLPTDITLLQLNFYCHRLMKQMRFMSGVCKCDQYDGSNKNSTLPVGLKLLNYLYKTTVESWDTDNYFLLLSLFQTSCIPFALYLQKWIFDGVCKDEYGEFMIRISDNAMHMSGNENWKTGFQLETSTSADNIPEFLADIIPDMIPDIFTCGQSLNLLRICCPQHFICNVDCNDVPQVQFFHSQAELKQLQQYCQCYFSKMNQIAAQRIQSRQDRREELIQRKKDLAIKVREVAVNELKRINDEIEAVRKIQRDKKAAQLNFFKKQMEEAHLRKYQAEQKSKEEMRRDAEILNDKEQALLKAKAMMKEEMKEKIVKHYADLSEQATLQKERALWHVRRSKLDSIRMEFLLEDEKKWKREMEEWKAKSKLAEPNDDAKEDAVNGFGVLEAEHNLPHWAQQGPKNVPADNVVVKPKSRLSWADKKKESGLTPSDDTQMKDNLFAKQNLPSWALKVAQGDGPQADVLTRLESAVTATPEFVLSKAGGDSPIYKHYEEQELKTNPEKSNSESFGTLTKEDSHKNLTESSSDFDHQFVPLRKHVEGQSVFKETMEDTPIKKVVESRKVVEGQSVSKETMEDAPVEKVVESRKVVEGQSVSKETMEDAPVEKVVESRKVVEGQSVSKETMKDSPVEKVVESRKRVEGQSVSKETMEDAPVEKVVESRKVVEGQSVSKETMKDSPVEKVVESRKRVEGQSVSKETMEDAPVEKVVESRKRVEGQSVSKETMEDAPVEKVVESRKRVEGQSVSKETMEDSPVEKVVESRKVVEGQSVSKETMKDSPVEKVVESRKRVEGQSISKETFTTLPEQKLVPSRKTVDDQFISKESLKTSPGDIAIFHRKPVDVQSSTKEAVDADAAQEEQVAPRRKRVDNQSVSKEMRDITSGEHVILRRKCVDNQSISRETVGTSSGDQVIPRRKRIDAHSIGKESSESTLNYRHSGIFISSSMVTQGNYEIEPPAWKQPEELYAQETDMKDFSIRRMSGVYPTEEFPLETIVSQVHRSQMKTPNPPHISATTESEYVDHEKLVRERFKQRNIHGHSSDSTIEKLLYGGKFGIRNDPDNENGMGVKDSSSTEGNEFETMFKAWKNSWSEPYETEFDFEGDRLVNIGRDLTYIVHGRSGIRSKASIRELEAYQHTPLSVLIQQSILSPITSQIELVNKCALDYFLVELSLDVHFNAFWNYLIMGDGDFAQNLTDLLFEKLSTNPHPNEVLNPMFLNGTLRKALKSSMCCDDKATDNLSFVVVQEPSSFIRGDDNQILNCLNLAYKIKWPLNIIITNECHQKYRHLYSFLLQLKQASWLLQQIWRQLKRDAAINRVQQKRKSIQFHQVQTFEHIMRELVRALQEYFVNQVLHLSWTEFQKSLESNVHNLDDLHRVHMDFLNVSLKRSLLTPQASHVMTMIKQLFNLIRSFHQTLTNQRWYQDPHEQGTIKHPNFPRLLKLYEEFTKYAKVFFKVITGLAQRRYEPHLQDLVLLFNFNYWFTDSI